MILGGLQGHFSYCILPVFYHLHMPPFSHIFVNNLKKNARVCGLFAVSIFLFLRNYNDMTNTV